MTLIYSLKLAMSAIFTPPLIVSERMLKVIPDEDTPGLHDHRRLEIEVFDLRAFQQHETDAVDRIRSILVSFAYDDDDFSFGEGEDRAVEFGRQGNRVELGGLAAQTVDKDR